MNVRELIQELSTYDPDLRVVYFMETQEGPEEVEHIVEGEDVEGENCVILI